MRQRIGSSLPRGLDIKFLQHLHRQRPVVSIEQVDRASTLCRFDWIAADRIEQNIRVEEMRQTHLSRWCKSPRDNRSEARKAVTFSRRARSSLFSRSVSLSPLASSTRNCLTNADTDVSRSVRLHARA